MKSEGSNLGGGFLGAPGGQFQFLDLVLRYVPHSRMNSAYASDGGRDLTRMTAQSGEFALRAANAVHSVNTT